MKELHCVLRQEVSLLTIRVRALRRLSPYRLIFLILLLCATTHFGAYRTLAEGGRQESCQTRGELLVLRGDFTPQQSEIRGNPNAIVWVNTNSGVYHCAGTRWYGRTKQGKYMKQREAQSAGYRPAYGSVCA